MFLSRPKPVKVEIVRRSLAQIGCGERHLTQRHYENILQLSEKNVTGKEIQLPGGFVASRDYGNLILTPSRESKVGQAPPCDDKSVTLNVPGRTRFGRYLIEAALLEADGAGFGQFVAGKSNWVERFDLETIELPLTVRFRRAGDRFIPLGMTSQKKLDRFLTDQRVPLALREQTLVIADAGKIIWFCPLRIDERVKVSGDTGSILQLQVTDVGTQEGWKTERRKTKYLKDSCSVIFL
jgi:tRNA(Ile)-lysidine synthase